jgi:hypothetical protein
MGEYRIGVWHMNGRVLGVGVCLLRFVVLVYCLESEMSSSYRHLSQ